MYMWCMYTYRVYTAVNHFTVACVPVITHMQAGETALYNASFRGHTQVADLLLKAKASVDTPNNDVSQVVFV